MNWLLDDNSDNGTYLGLDDPAMPDSAPAPPSAPSTGAAPDAWLDPAAGGSSSDWLGAAPEPAAVPVHGSTAGGTVVDSQAEWMAADPGMASSAQAAPATGYASHDAPAAGGYDYSAPVSAPAAGMGMSITSPMLDEVEPNPRSLGGQRGDLNDLVLDVEVQVEVGLGNAALTVEEFLEMGRGSVVELDTALDAPIELKVRGKLIARGQLVSVGGRYGMRIIEMTGEER